MVGFVVLSHCHALWWVEVVGEVRLGWGYLVRERWGWEIGGVLFVLLGLETW